MPTRTSPGRRAADRAEGIVITGHVPPWMRRALVWLGVTSLTSTTAVVVGAARWIGLPDQVERNTSEIADLKAGQAFLVCVADAQVDHVDPAACKSLAPPKRR